VGRIGFRNGVARGGDAERRFEQQGEGEKRRAHGLALKAECEIETDAFERRIQPTNAAHAAQGAATLSCE
jgi:hypothetical protein